MHQFGENVRIRREARGWTQPQLGDLMGVGRAAVANWEKGKNMPPGEDLIKLAEVFRVTVAELLGEVEEVLRTFGPKTREVALTVTPDQMRQILDTLWPARGSVQNAAPPLSPTADSKLTAEEQSAMAAEGGDQKPHVSSSPASGATLADDMTADILAKLEGKSGKRKPSK